MEENRRRKRNLFIVPFTYHPYSPSLLHYYHIDYCLQDGQISRYPYVATVRRLAPSASPATTTTTGEKFIPTLIGLTYSITLDCSAPSTTSAPAAAPASGGVGGVGSGAPSAGSAAAAAGSFLQRTAKFRRYER